VLIWRLLCRHQQQITPRFMTKSPQTIPRIRLRQETLLRSRAPRFDTDMGHYGSCRSVLTSRLGVGAGPTLALDRASKLVTLGRTGAAHHRTITDNSG
jgi:hypothetical protein